MHDMYRTYYQTLHLHPGADNDDIKRAYRKLAKSYHPDLSGDPSTARKFIKIKQAYDALINKQHHTGYGNTTTYYYTTYHRQNTTPPKTKKQRASVDPNFRHYTKKQDRLLAMIKRAFFITLTLPVIIAYVVYFVFGYEIKDEPAFFLAIVSNGICMCLFIRGLLFKYNPKKDYTD